MSSPVTIEQTDHKTHQDIDREIYDRVVFGFWIYVMTDCVLFATLFAVYAVLYHNTFGGPSGQDLFSLPFALTETLILLTSSFSCGLAMLAAHQQAKKMVLTLFGITFLLGLAFLGMELNEFNDFIQEGYSWQRSAFLSSFFTLVGTHGLHITFGLLWIFVMMCHILFRGLTLSTLRRLTCLSMFWHFLDVIWIFIFTFVYLMGVK
jgi:cytochrome o ubiquinol oxidase subunit 3